MQLTNTDKKYGILSIALHWLVALLVFTLFGLGLWMMSLDYYDSWYQQAPWLHKGLGVTVLLLLLIRILWFKLSPRPAHVSGLTGVEISLAGIMHWLLNLLILLICISGYLIVTATGDELTVFDLFSLPAIIDSIDNLEDVAGKIHEYLAWALIGLALLHALAACKHHWINKDTTLLRMLGRG